MLKLAPTAWGEKSRDIVWQKFWDGAALAKQVRDEVALGVAEMREQHGVMPGLAAVLVGGGPGLGHLCSE